jgi:hypothetical protein
MKTVRQQGLVAVSVAAIGLLALAIGEPGYSHHSFPATYVEAETTRIEGELASFMFRNPHSFIHVSVKEDSGETVRYAVEWGAAARLARQGVNRGTFKPGDVVIITGLPGRNPEDHRVLLKTIERPSDGFRWGFEEGETFE